MAITVNILEYINKPYDPRMPHYVLCETWDFMITPFYSNEHTWIHHLVASIFFLLFYSSHLDIVIDVEAFMFWVLLFFLKNLCFDGVTKIVENLDSMNVTHIMDVQDLKEP